jgi:hypothetical protein
MTNPRDTTYARGPTINQVTGLPITEAQQKRLDAIQAAGDALAAAMHEAEGSNPPDGPFQEHHWQSRRMLIAATHLETCLMFARKAALEAR